MKEPVVSDSTCLIGLERIGALDILPVLFTPILIPPEVQQELGITLPWLTVQAPADVALVAALKLLVEAGEAEAMAWAQERGYRLVLDDRPARAGARRLGILRVGTVGILVQAKRSGIIPVVKPLLIALEEASFYIGEDLKQEALRIANE